MGGPLEPGEWSIHASFQALDRIVAALSRRIGKAVF